MFSIASVAGLLALGVAAVTSAAELPEFPLAIRNHTYQPHDLTVPADTKFKLVVTNEDSTPEEFESTDFNRETIVLPKHTTVVFVGPLHPGNYGFFGDFHRDTAQGRLIVE
ncbi:MAG: hypothetical protein NVSMB10_17480 [Steroidobacteraceae bacterium]